jgi:endonuclease-3
MTRKERFRLIIDYFKVAMPIAETEIEYQSPYELIVATILSAQCTDKRVNMTTPAFFKKYPTVHHLANAKVEEIFQIIKSISYPNNKAHHLSGMAKMLIEDFGGVIPSDIDQLQRLPGVGRKTANVVASVAFNKPALAVDTHVFRVARRMGLSHNAKTPLQTELQLIEHIPEVLIPIAHHWLILHGRYVCVARKPKCGECGVRDFCKEYSKIYNEK